MFNILKVYIDIFFKSVLYRFKIWNSNTVKNPVIIGVLTSSLKKDENNLESKEEIKIEETDVNDIVEKSNTIIEYINQHSDEIVLVICLFLGLVFCYYQGYFFWIPPYIFIEQNLLDVSKFKGEVILLLKKPVIEWTYSDTLLIYFHHPEVFSYLDFSKLNPYVCCKFLSFFKSISYKDIGFKVPEQYIEYVLDTSGKIIPKEFEPYYADAMNNIIIDSNLCDQVILSEVKSILPQVLSNPNADPALVAKLLTDDAILITKKVLLEDFNINPMLIKLYIPEEILTAAIQIVESGGVTS